MHKSTPPTVKPSFKLRHIFFMNRSNRLLAFIHETNRQIAAMSLGDDNG